MFDESDKMSSSSSQRVNKIQVITSPPTGTTDETQLLNTPLICCKFTYGLPTQLAQTTDDHNSSSLTATLYGNTKEPRKSTQRAVLCSTHSNNDDSLDHQCTPIYVGTNYHENSYKNSLHHYAVGIYNNETHTLRLHDLSHIYPMVQRIKAPTVPPLNDDEDNNEHSIDANDVQFIDDDGYRAIMDTAPSIGGDSSTTPFTAADYAQQRNKLIEQYGSKKRKRQIRSEAMNKIESTGNGTAPAPSNGQGPGHQEHEGSNTMNQALDMTLQQTKEQLQNADEANKANTSSSSSIDPNIQLLYKEILPPFNPSTSNVTEIYDKYEIITVDEWESLDYRRLFRLLKSGDLMMRSKQQHEYSDYVYHRLEVLQQRQTSSQASNDDTQLQHEKDQNLNNKIDCKLLLYIDALIKFLNIKDHNPSYAMTKICQQYHIHESIYERLLNEFSEKQENSNPPYTKYSVTKGKKTKGYLYLCVLSLIVCHYTMNKIDIQKLCDSLKLTYTTLSQYARQVGATTSKNEFKLTAPLKLPEFRGMKRGRR